jgi:hypothetical protein
MVEQHVLLLHHGEEIGHVGRGQRRRRRSRLEPQAVEAGQVHEGDEGAEVERTGEPIHVAGRDLHQLLQLADRLVARG